MEAEEEQSGPEAQRWQALALEKEPAVVQTAAPALGPCQVVLQPVLQAALAPESVQALVACPRQARAAARVARGCAARGCGWACGLGGGGAAAAAAALAFVAEGHAHSEERARRALCVLVCLRAATVLCML